VLPWLLIAAALMLAAKASTVVAVERETGVAFAQSVSASARCVHHKAQLCGTIAFGCYTSCDGPSAVAPGAICLTTPTRQLPDPTFIPAILDLRRAPDPYPPRPISIS
jgi:hypothetical protein